jgi:hypothetical protein
MSRSEDEAKGALWGIIQEVQLDYIKRRIKQYRARDEWIDGLQNDLDEFVEWLEDDIKHSTER